MKYRGKTSSLKNKFNDVPTRTEKDKSYRLWYQLGATVQHGGLFRTSTIKTVPAQLPHRFNLPPTKFNRNQTRFNSWELE